MNVLGTCDVCMGCVYIGRPVRAPYRGARVENELNTVTGAVRRGGGKQPRVNSGGCHHLNRLRLDVNIVKVMSGRNSILIISTLVEWTQRGCRNYEVLCWK